MAPVLLCPECGTKHPLDSVGEPFGVPVHRLRPHAEGARAGRARSAAGDRRAPPVAAAPRSPLPWPVAVPPRPSPALGADPHATQAFRRRRRRPPLAPPPTAQPALAPLAPVSRPPDPAPARGADRRDLIPPRWVRFLLWIVAVPLAFPRRVRARDAPFGVLTTNEVTDVALAEGWHRFWPIARLLPFVALATARARARRRVRHRAAAPATAPRRRHAGTGRLADDVRGRVSRRAPARSSRPPAAATRRHRSRRDSARCGRCWSQRLTSMSSSASARAGGTLEIGRLDVVELERVGRRGRRARRDRARARAGPRRCRSRAAPRRAARPSRAGAAAPG